MGKYDNHLLEDYPEEERLLGTAAFRQKIATAIAEGVISYFPLVRQPESTFEKAISYETRRTTLPHIRSITMDREQDSIIMDAATRRNLEITQNLAGGAENTLASVLDCTVTPMGSRMLKRWLHRHCLCLCLPGSGSRRGGYLSRRAGGC